MNKIGNFSKQNKKKTKQTIFMRSMFTMFSFQFVFPSRIDANFEFFDKQITTTDFFFLFCFQIDFQENKKKNHILAAERRETEIGLNFTEIQWIQVHAIITHRFFPKISQSYF